MKKLGILTARIAALLLCTSSAHGFLSGTVAVTLGASVVPGLVTADPGQLQTFYVMPNPFSTGTASGTYEAAVFKNSGGTLDFYFQFNNSANSSDAISRIVGTSFLGFATAVGYRIDGNMLATPTGNPQFSNGGVAPVEADRNAGGDMVGFNFQPPASAEVLAGLNSCVLVISTDALGLSSSQSGHLSVVAGGTGTVENFQPAAIPEPSSGSLLVGGLLAIAMSLMARQRLQS